VKAPLVRVGFAVASGQNALGQILAAGSLGDLLRSVRALLDHK